MKSILSLSILLLGSLACSQTHESKKPKLTADFFYGAWADSLNQQTGGKGIIFGDEHDFHIIWDGNISGGENFKKNLRLTYKLHLDKEPLQAEIISTYIDTDSVNTIRFATIEVIDDRHLRWKLVDDKGKTLDSAFLTKASNKGW